MSTVNQATALGINAVNKARQSTVEAEAQVLINAILANNKSIKSYQKSISDEQVKLNELALDVVDQRGVLGLEFGTPLNPNQVTIVNAIKKINDARQESVSVVSQGHINRIKQYEATIAALNKSNDETRKKLTELAVDVVSIESVVAPVAQ